MHQDTFLEENKTTIAVQDRVNEISCLIMIKKTVLENFFKLINSTLKYLACFVPIPLIIHCMLYSFLFYSHLAAILSSNASISSVLRCMKEKKKEKGIMIQT